MRKLIQPVVMCVALMTSASAMPAVTNSVVTEAFTQKIKGLENIEGRDGDNGNSRGPYQISFNAWKDVNRALKGEANIFVYGWDDMRLESPSRYYCLRYCRWIEAVLKRRYEKVTPAMIYAAYNAGVTTFVRHGGKVSRMPKAVRERCAIFDD